jgi:hypothetical protein
MKPAATKINKSMKPIIGFFRKSIKSIAIILGIFFVTFTFVFALSFSLFFYWVSDHSTKHIGSSSSRMLEYVINLSNSNLVDLENTTLKYSRDKDLLVSTKIRINKKISKEEIATIDSLDISIGMKDIFRNKSIPVSINMNNSKIKLDKFNNAPLQELNISTSKQRHLFDYLRKYSIIFFPQKVLFVDNISADNLEISYKKQTYNIDTHTVRNKDTFSFSSKIKNNGKNSTFSTHIQNDQNIIKVRTRAKYIPFTILSSMLPHNSFLNSPSLDKLGIDGDIKYSFDKNHSRNSIEVSLKDHNDSNLLKIEANNHKKENQLHLKDMYIFSGDSTIQANGYADLSNGFQLSKINLSAKNLHFEQLLSYWPKNSLSSTRKWIKESLSDGEFDAQINFDSQNISSKQDLVEINFRDISLKYTNGFSPLKNLNGILKIYNNKIDIHVKEGDMLSSKIHKSTASIDLSKNNTPLEIKVRSSGFTKDYIQFLGQEKVSQLKNRSFDTDNISGTVDSNIGILIPLSSGNIPKDIQITANAKIQNTEASIMKNITLEKGEFDLSLDNKKLKVTGNADVSNYDCKIELLGNLDSNEAIQTQVNFKTSIKDSKKFADHFNQRIHITEGEPTVDITYISSDDTEKVSAQIDINEAKLSLPDIGLIKKRGDPTHLEFELVRSKNSNWKTESFSLTSPKIDAKSYMEISTDFDKILNMETDISYHGNSFKIKYLLEEDKRIIKIHGSEIDLRHANILDLANINKYSPEDKSSLSIQADKLLMKNDITFHNIVGNFECKSHHCNNSGFSMKINSEDSLNLTLDPDDNKRWTFNTNNAAGLLKGLGIYKDIEGGELEGTMHFVDNPREESRVLVGELRMKDFKAVKTPTIAKLFLLSPFSVIKKSFAKSPLIPFEKMKASFLYTNDKLHLNRSYAIGNSMSVTIEGSIDNKEDKIDLHGKIIPKSRFNSFLASLKGRKATEEEKQGALGNHFMIEGNVSEPSVKINPLSALVSFVIRLNPLWLI